MQGSKQNVTKLVALVKNGRKYIETRLFFYKNIDVSPLFGVILYIQRTFTSTNEIRRELPQKV